MRRVAILASVARAEDVPSRTGEGTGAAAGEAH